MTSFRQMSFKASRANNFWWKLSGVLGDSREARLVMYCAIQAVFTVATLAFTVLMFCNYHLHALFQVFKCAAALWNGKRQIARVRDVYCIVVAASMSCSAGQYEVSTHSSREAKGYSGMKCHWRVGM